MGGEGLKTNLMIPRYQMKETTITLRVHLKELKNMDKAGSEISGGIQENAEWEKAQLPAPTFASVFVIFLYLQDTSTCFSKIATTFYPYSFLLLSNIISYFFSFCYHLSSYVSMCLLSPEGKCMNCLPSRIERPSFS